MGKPKDSGPLDSPIMLWSAWPPTPLFCIEPLETHHTISGLVWPKMSADSFLLLAVDLIWQFCLSAEHSPLLGGTPGFHIPTIILPDAPPCGQHKIEAKFYLVLQAELSGHPLI